MDFFMGIIASIIGSLVIGGTIGYRVISKSRQNNKGIKQSEGSNQIALQKSKGNTVYVGGESGEKQEE